MAERLTVEITETAAIQDIDDVQRFVTRLKNLGSRIAIDDFGAGYTSFRNLRKLGVDIVKIDGAFVHNLARSAQAVELDLSAYEGRRPVEVFGRSRFPRIGELPYLLTLAPRGFYWFQLTEDDSDD